MKSLRWTGVVAVSFLLIGATAWRASSHCQIPCGIYDDAARLSAIAEHTRTVEKSIVKITELSSAAKPDYNQLVRWVASKDTHADKIAHIVTYYFMTQRVKPADPNDARAHGQYVKKITLLHRMLVAAMKAKQTTDLRYTKELTRLLGEFTNVYGAKVRS